MSQPDYYQIFGVAPSASADEIRAAHRELVKRYHPDIYWTSADKARATEKLRAVNEAYAVLGNPQRRKEYDANRAAAARSPAAAERPTQPAPVRQRPARAKPATNKPRRNAPDWMGQARDLHREAKKVFTIRRLAGTVVVLTLGAAAAYSLTRPPPITPAWVLWQRTEIEPAGGAGLGDAKGWEAVGSFGVRVACTESLRSRLKRDQDEGSQVVFDEVNATLAITVLLSKNESALNQDAHNGRPKSVKRVRHYECRAVPVRQSESWLRRKLRSAGLIS
jgi:hypothetical protein